MAERPRPPRRAQAPKKRRPRADLEAETGHLREEHYRVLSQTMLQGVVYQDSDGKIVSMNPAAERILGKSPAEFLGLTSVDVAHHTLREDGSPFPGQEHPSMVALRTGRAVEHVVMGVFNSREQAYRWISVSAVPVFRPRGKKPYRVYAVFDDITARKRAEEALQESEKRFRVLAEAMPQIVWSADATGAVDYYNPRTYEYSGVEEQEIKGWNWTSVIHPDDLEATKAAWREALRTGEIFQVEQRLRRADGAYRWHLTRGVALRDEQGAVTRWIGTATDIHDRKGAEEAARRAKEEWEQTFDTVPDLIAVLDEKHRVLRANRAMAERLGTTPSKCIGLSCYQAVHGASEPPGSCPHARTCQDGKEHSSEVHEPRLKGDFLVTTTPRFDEQGRVIGAVHVARDVTERKKREEDLQKLNRVLQAHRSSGQEMLRARDEVEYLHEVCRIIIEECGHAMVWVGYAEQDEAKTVRPVAQAGFEEGYLQTLSITWADAERGRGPTGTAIRTGRPSSCPSMLTDPRFAPWRAEALKRGYASSLAVPLLDEGKAFGALTIYAKQPDAFSDEEVKLLGDLADDVAYGIASLRVRDAHGRAVEELAQSEERARSEAARLQAVLDTAPAIIWIAQDAECTSITGNRAAHEFSRVPSDADMSKTGAQSERLAHYRILENGKELTPRDLPMQRVAATGQPISNCALDFVFDDGVVRTVLGNVTPLLNTEGKPTGAVGVFVDSTERRRALNELRETRDYLDNLLNYANAPIIVWDPAFRITRFNRAFERLTGRRAQDTLGQPIEILFPEEGKAEALAQVRRAGSGERLETVEIPIRRTDGAVRMVLWNSATLFVADGTTIVATIAQGQDITERKQAEAEREALLTQTEEDRHRIAELAQALRRERDVLNTIMEHTQTRLAYLDPEFRFVRVNSAYARSFSLKQEEELLGRGYSEIFPQAEDRPALERVRDTGQVVEQLDRPFRLPGQPEHGVSYWDWTLVPVKGADGSVEGLVLSLHETTERKRATEQREQLLEELALERARWQAVVESMVDMVCICNAEGQTTYLNPAFARLLKRPMPPNLPAEEIPAHHRAFTSAGEPFPADELPAQRAAATGHEVRNVEVCYRPDPLREHVTTWNAAPLRGPDGAAMGAVAVGHDVTEERDVESLRHQLEEALREANSILERQVQQRTAELQAANVQLKQEIEERQRAEAERQRVETIARGRERLALLGELAAGVAHELRNPMQGVMGYLELARRQTGGGGELNPVFEQIQGGLQQMDRLASQLLDLARSDQEPIRPTLLQPVVEQAWGFLRVRAGKRHVDLQQDFDPALPPVRGNASRLSEAFLNLFKNSLDALEEAGSSDGSIAVKAHLHPKLEGMVEVLVTDNGPGIPPTVRAKVFDAFFTTKPSGKGTGLGLAMVRKMAESCGGCADVVDVSGPGTTISLTLPVAGPPTLEKSGDGFVIT
jgi:PAS domain S-box-containing protein